MSSSNFLSPVQLHKGSQNFVISEISSKISMQTDASNANSKAECKEPLWKCRYGVVLLGFFVFFFLNGYRLNMSVTLVAMVNNTAFIEKAQVKSQSCTSLLSNVTLGEDLDEVQKDGEFIWSPKIQGYVLSSYFVGYVVMQIPTGLLVERFGCKWFLLLGSAITSVCTLMMPPLARMGVWSFVAVNAVRGLAQGLIQPSMSVLTANWFPKMERGLLYTIILSGSPLGSFLASVFSGLLCKYSGWDSSFYTIGGSSIVLSMCIAFLIHESPNVHPGISKAEQDFILGNQECVLSKRRPNVPWRKMVTSLPVFALSLANFGQYWAISQFFIVQATYLATILHYPIGQNGLFTALPFLFQWVVVQSSGVVSGYLQKRNMASVDSLRKLGTLIASVGSSVCFLGIYLAGCNRNLSILFGIASIASTGAGYSGCWITSTDMSPQFAGSLNAFSLTFACTSSVILPLVVGYLTDTSQTIEQWNKVMFISMGIVLTTGVFFALFGSAEVQPWNFVDEPESKISAEIKDSENKKEREITRL